MATTVNVTSNYAGKAAGEIIGASFKEADTLRLNLLTIAENVNYKYNLRRIRYTDGTVDYTCGFTAEGEIGLDEKVIEPKKFKTPIQVCKEDFRQTWSEDLEGASAHNVTMASDIETAITKSFLLISIGMLDITSSNSDITVAFVIGFPDGVGFTTAASAVHCFTSPSNSPGLTLSPFHI